MLSYLRKPLVDAILSTTGRLLIVFMFVGAAAAHLSPAGWAPTIADMQSRGVPAPQLALTVSMIVSSIASLALLVDIKPRWAAYSLAAYTLIVSSVMHNPMHAVATEFYLFVKDLGIAGALMIFGSALGAAPLTERPR